MRKGLIGEVFAAGHQSLLFCVAGGQDGDYALFVVLRLTLSGMAKSAAHLQVSDGINE